MLNKLSQFKVLKDRKKKLPRIDLSNGYYEGEWQNGMCDGFGIHHYLNGDIYKGFFFKLDKAEASGKLTYSNEDIYEGMWANDQAHGFGFLDFCKKKVILKNNFITNDKEVRDMRGDGQIIDNMEKESKLGPMALNMQGFINLEKNHERESFYLLIKVFQGKLCRQQERWLWYIYI